MSERGDLVRPRAAVEPDAAGAPDPARVPAPLPQREPHPLELGAAARPIQRLGEALIERGYLTERQLKVALDEQHQVRRPLGEILVALGFVRAEIVAQHLADELGLPLVRGRDLRPDPLLVSGLDPAFVRELRALPIAFVGSRLRVAMVDPTDPHKVARIRAHFGCDLELVMLLESELLPLMRKHFPEAGGGMRDLIARAEQRPGEGEEFPVERFTETLIVDGIRRGATDIHLHPEEGVTRIRYRIDGVLRQIDILPRNATAGVVSRIKILAELDISERRRPQDGHIRFPVDGRRVDLRASIVPTSLGESVVLRVLDRAAGNIPLQELGIPERQCQLLRRVAERPHGLFLVTGPTGSGKTTTLYSLLSEVDALRRNVVTVEDPVEYGLPFIRQSQVEPAVGFDFAAGLRGLLRQDPDVILVGEIRDSETAGMAIKASMTGHLVLSTLHTNTAIGAIPRLVDIGVQPFLIEDALIGVLAQRLVRRVCAGCVQTVEASEAERAFLGDGAREVQRGRGCTQCEGTGFSGRLAISELFLPDERVAAALRVGATFADLVGLARAGGFEDMLEDGRAKVREGRTTCDEVLRVHRSHRLSEEERRGA